MQTSGRLSNVAPPCILRKNPPSSRNGGHETDAQILELNQQVRGEKVGVAETTLPQQPGWEGRLRGASGLSTPSALTAVGPEADSGRAGEGA